MCVFVCASFIKDIFSFQDKKQERIPSRRFIIYIAMKESSSSLPIVNGLKLYKKYGWKISWHCPFEIPLFSAVLISCLIQAFYVLPLPLALRKLFINFPPPPIRTSRISLSQIVVNIQYLFVDFSRKFPENAANA